MPPSSVFHSISARYNNQNQKMVEYVKQACPVEKLFLLGVTISNRRTETLFTATSATASHISHYYLLALVEHDDDQGGISAIQDKIENNLQNFIPATAIVLSVTQYNNWLSGGHPFAGAVAERAQTLYDASGTTAPLPAGVNGEAIKLENEKLARRTKIVVSEFLAGADLFCIRQQYKLSAFMLHQAAEQALRTMFILHTGLHINTHNIDKLIRYCSMFSYRLPDLFPKNNEHNKRLYQLLQKAYIHTRYKDDYNIRQPELMELTAKVKAIQTLFEKSLAPTPKP